MSVVRTVGTIKQVICPGKRDVRILSNLLLSPAIQAVRELHLRALQLQQRGRLDALVDRLSSAVMESARADLESGNMRGLSRTTMMLQEAFTMAVEIQNQGQHEQPREWERSADGLMQMLGSHGITYEMVLNPGIGTRPTVVQGDTTSRHANGNGSADPGGITVGAIDTNGEPAVHIESQPDGNDSIDSSGHLNDGIHVIGNSHLNGSSHDSE